MPADLLHFTIVVNLLSILKYDANYEVKLIAIKMRRHLVSTIDHYYKSFNNGNGGGTMVTMATNS